MKNQIAYIDEFGNNGLDFEKEGVSNTFIVTAIIISEENLKTLETKLEVIRKKHFQTGEIKSSKVGKNDKRRLNIIADLSELDYHIFSIVIDKTQLKGEGFQYKGSFYKFLHSLVDRELFKTFPDLLVVADEHGGEDFKESLIKYMRNTHIPNLFRQSEFKLSNSKSELMVQLADFITGSIARCYETKKMSSNRNEILSSLRKKLVEIRYWPIQYKPMAYDPGKDFDNYDPTISDLGLNLATQFLDKFSKSTAQHVIDQCTCLRYLLFHFRNINPETYVTTAELINQIEQVRPSGISQHYFRSKVIAKIRDNGIILASSNKGYKLPSSSQDLYAFVNHSNSYIQPMIDRLIKCRNQIKLATKELDIFDHEEFRYLNIIKDNLLK